MEHDNSPSPTYDQERSPPGDHSNHNYGAHWAKNENVYYIQLNPFLKREFEAKKAAKEAASKNK